MGKAIISTPLQNALPQELMHGEHIHFIHNEEQMRDAMQLLIHDKIYREHLEGSAREYFHNYGRPSAVIKQIVGSISQ